MSNKEKLLERYPNAEVYNYPYLSLYGNTTKVWCVTIGEHSFTGDTESKVCKTAMANMPVKND